MSEEGTDRHPVRTLVFFLAAGVGLFVAGLYAVLTLLGSVGGAGYDASVLSFYPFMAALGAVFGFERWWSYELGPYNPIHDN